ncbi:MAG TPA: hypothetical protein VNI36_11450 [Candidatus Dormibacteraeota bacterium]|nr:hypothetical protein [Candidatus Dormibacteraeota bacterium]
MRKFLVLCGALLCFSLTAMAQESAATFAASSPAGEPASPATLAPSNRSAWQLGVGYQYQHFKVLGQDFHTSGFNTDVTRYLNNWFGIEGAVTGGFGHTGPSSTYPNLVAKSFFIGGGVHVAVPNSSRLEPWFHALAGWERFRFTQTSTIGVNSGPMVMAGGGVDYKFNDRVYWRFQGDFLGSRIESTVEKNYSFGSGLVFNF